MLLDLPPTLPAARAFAEGGAVAITPTAFVCQNYTCQAPTTDPARVRQLLAAPNVGRPVVKPMDFLGM